MITPSSSLRPGEKIIRVLLVDDSPVALNLLQRMLVGSPGIQVVGTANNGKAALELLPELRPDVICTDLYMPVMDGLVFTQRVMAEFPCPILVISVSVGSNSLNAFKLLGAGAVDVLSKPTLYSEVELAEKSQELASKIRILSGVKMFKRCAPSKESDTPTVAPQKSSHVMPRLVVIGASTGGPQALYEILGELPKNFPVPILCVQHIVEDFLLEMVRWLASHCPMPLSVAQEGERPCPGTVYFAPANRHLYIDEVGLLAYSQAATVDGHKPSVTFTMKSAARYYRSATVGVLLTGMGRDGADGMAAIAAAGGQTLAESESSCVVYGMPKEAIALGVVQHVIPLQQMATTLKTIANCQQ